MSLKLSGKPVRYLAKGGRIRWTQFWYDAEGRRRSITRDTSAKAKEAALKKVEVAATLFDNEQPGTFASLAERFCKDSEVGRQGKFPLSRPTISSYRAYIKSRLNPELGKMKISEITNGDMRELSNKLISEMGTREGAKRAFTLAKTILKYGHQLDLIPSVPGSDLTIQSDWNRTEQNKRRTVPLMSEIEALDKCALESYHSENIGIKRAYTRYYPLYLSLRFLGIRVSEALALQWGDFNKEMSFVTIQRRVCPPEKNLAQEDRISRPKTKSAIRRIPIPAPVHEPLRELQKLQDGPWLFSTQAGNPLNYSNVLSNFWIPLCRRANVKGLGPHSLRHYYASTLIRARRYKEASYLLGHSSTTFTMDRYAHIIKDDEARFEGISDILAPK